MDAATFETLFRRWVVEPTVAVGFERWGKDLWFESDGLQAAVFRTESRSNWPFRLTLALRFDCLRDFDDRFPAPRTRNVSEWPIKIKPSAARDLVGGSWRYEPYNLGSWPADQMTDATVAVQLGDIGAALVDTFPAVVAELVPARLREQIHERGEGAWCERRWLEDLDPAEDR